MYLLYFQAVVVCYEPEASELSVLDLYSFGHDAIGAGSAVRAHEPEVVRPTGMESSHFQHVYKYELYNAR